MFVRCLYITLAILLITFQESYSQAVRTPFGKNRIQYHDDFRSWSRYETENFVTYWYGKARNVAHATIQIAELEHSDIQELLEYRMNDKIEIVVYTDLTDLKQSNIGNEEIFNNISGETKTVGQKIFVQFNGDHQDLRSQIRQGIASVYLTNILNGSSIQEAVQNALLLHMPDWFNRGLITYADESWNADLDQRIEKHLLNPKYLDFDTYADRYPQEAGHSLWYFLENTYGRTKISQLIYITRIYRSLEGSFPYVLNETFYSIKKKWSEYYREYYDLDNYQAPIYDGLEIARVKKKYGEQITHLSFNTQGNALVYTVNTLGKQELMLHTLDDGKTTRLFKNEKKNPFQSADVNYPIVTWTPNGRSLYLLYEWKDVKYLRYLYLDDLDDFEEEDIPENYQRIYSMDFVEGDKLLFSGSYNGVSDLFYYKPSARSTKRITEDFWDDLDAQYVNSQGRSGILFRSNRETYTLKTEKLDTILPLGSFDLFFLEDGSEEIIQLTNTPGINIHNGRVTEDGKLIYLQEKNSKYRRMVKDFLGSSSPETNSEATISILDHDISLSGDYVYLIEDAKTYTVYYQPSLDLTASFTESGTQQENTIDYPDNVDEVEESEEITYGDGKKFQSKWPDPEGTEPILSEKTTVKKDGFGEYYDNYYSGATNADGDKIIKFEPYRASAQRLTFRLYDYSSKIDNQPLFEGLESYTEVSQNLTAQPTTIHIQAKVKDIFEDYKLHGGFRIPTSFSGSEAYLTLFDDKKRWDKSYTLYRRMQSEFIPSTGVFERYKQHTIMGRAQWKYPLSIFKSWRLSSSLRLDRSFFAITETTRLEEPFDFAKRLSGKVEYIYDNSFDLSTNIKNGTRYKIFLEAINEFDLDISDGVNFSPSTGFTGIFGFDARHYLPIFRKAVLAFRGSGATSFGNKTMLYYLGGVESWVLPQYNNSTSVPESINYSYVALAPHLRGFDYNTRNGGSYLLANMEFRIPIFSLIAGNSIKNGFIRNFQVIGFADAGIAWHGLLPSSDINPLNEDSIVTTDANDDNILVLNITYFRDPIAYGYGWGVRSTLLGYYVKFDYAYGVETGTIQAPKWYISLGYDF